MSKHKHIDKICCIAVVFALLLTMIFMNGQSLGIKSTGTVMGYENRLFDTSRVHTIDIVMDDWDSFIDTCVSEEYSSCSVVIDGEAYSSVGIRGKGNTSLSSVSSMGSERYSFKIEFDQYDSTKSYYGLDKLSLNNLIQDNTFMKDYLAYRMMGEFGADAPLCSYVYITVNGEDWGLYLAVEGVEDAFLKRSYGSDYGELYKPDSMSFGGGRGNGKEFSFDDLDLSFGSAEDKKTDEDASQENQLPQGDNDAETDEGNQMPNIGGDMSEIFGGQMPNMGGDMSEIFDGQMPNMGGDMSEIFGGQMPNMGGDMSEIFGGQMPNMGGDMSEIFGGQMPNMGGDMSEIFGDQMSNDYAQSQVPDGEALESVSGTDADSENESKPPVGGSERPSFSGGFGMGSSDVKLQYIDDNPESYSNIFNNAKTDITDADKSRLIESLELLSKGENLSEIVDVDEVIRYFVVHNFVVNGDSYTGSMIHNYYLYEEDGQLSMIPWDYNLAYGTFMGADASGSVNDPIDSPVSGGSTSDRPMIDWIFSNEEYTELYHQYFSEFISKYFDTGYIDEMIASTTEMIAPYVEKDPTRFCTYEEFITGAETIREFCSLRAESVRGQLDGTIPSTSSGQSADRSALVDTSGVTISAMGTMGGGFGGGRKDFASQTASGSDIPSGNVSSREDWQSGGVGDFPSKPSGSESDKWGGQPGREDTVSNGDKKFDISSWNGQFSGQMSGGKNTGNISSWALLAASAVILAAGLIIVWKYKR